MVEMLRSLDREEMEIFIFENEMPRSLEREEMEVLFIAPCSP